MYRNFYFHLTFNLNLLSIESQEKFAELKKTLNYEAEIYIVKRINDKAKFFIFIF